MIFCLRITTKTMMEMDLAQEMQPVHALIWELSAAPQAPTFPLDEHFDDGRRTLCPRLELTAQLQGRGNSKNCYY